jgi:two-component system, chemotaxis family, sensor kinase CheA
MDDLLEQFLIESRDLLADAGEALKLLRQDTSDARVIDAAFRAIHTLKGSVAIFDMAPAEAVLHAAEDRLSHARSEGAKISADDVALLIATLDQIDRWVDQLEHNGALAQDAHEIARSLLVATTPEQTLAPPVPGDMPNWLAALLDRHDTLVVQHEAALIAFRYMPDSDAFFRGDDPLGLIAQVPAMVTFDLLPPEEDWPAVDVYEPFTCIMAIEGLSSATMAELVQAFRLVPGQVTLLPALPRDIEVHARTGSDFSTGSERILRVEAARLDQLADDVGELGVVTNAFAALAARVELIDRRIALDIRAAQANLERAIGAVSQSVSAVRMVSLATVLRRLPRLAREIAAELGKSVTFDMIGERTEVDKQIADGIFEPLLHLVRNAIDHGIETEARRVAGGKPTAGRVSLHISREADEIVVVLADDGAGIDRAKVRDTAVGRGLVTLDSADALSDAGTLALLFAPGFSTAATVSGVSGRGVGLDAVQVAIDRMRGRIEIDSRPGSGTTIRLRLPANAITTRLLVIEVAHNRYAVPLDQITETVRVSGERLIPVGRGIACVLRNAVVPVLSLAELLGNAEAGTLPAKLLVTRVAGDPVALRIDRFHQRIDALVRPPTGLLANISTVGGTTVMGDGTVLLVLDVAELCA